MATFFYTKAPVRKTADDRGGKPPNKKRRGLTREVTVTYKRQEALLKAMSQVLRVDLFRGIETFKDRIDPEQLAAAWASGDYDKIRHLIPWQSLPEDLEPAFATVGVAADRAAAIQLEALPANINANLRFDASNPAIRSMTEAAGSRVVQNVYANTQQVISDAVTNSFINAVTPRQIANQIKGSIGLLPNHVLAVEKYRQNLLAGGMNPSQAEGLAASYEGRLLDYRAMMIARTETRTAANASQLAVWDEAVRQGFVDKETAQKEWVVDGAPCDVCEPMDGIRVGLYDTWLITYADGSTLNVQSPSESHPNCLCNMELHYGHAGKEEDQEGEE